MSLLSLRNFTGPFFSKPKMGALAIAVILVLVIRLGTSRSGAGERANARDVTDGAAGTEELLKVLNGSQGPTKSRRQARSGDDLLDGLVADGLANKPNDQGDASAVKNEAFEDIRKSLGLE